MVTADEYLKGILEKIIISYTILSQLHDLPGDLEIIKKEIFKINGFFSVLINKMGSEKFQSDEVLNLKSKFEYYLNSYSFVNEIDTMAELYSNDTDRLKNIRLKILESLENKKLMNDIEFILEKL